MLERNPPERRDSGKKRIPNSCFWEVSRGHAKGRGVWHRSRRGEEESRNKNQKKKTQQRKGRKGKKEIIH